MDSDAVAGGGVCPRPAWHSDFRAARSVWGALLDLDAAARTVRT